MERPPQPTRTEPREIVELRRLKEDQPDLASAADLQIQLLQLQRRVQSRVPLPGINLDSKHLDELLAAGKPILTFEQVPIDWSDLRFLLRSTADAMRTHDAIEPDDYRRVDALTRDADGLPAVVREWYEAARPPPRAAARSRRRSPGSSRCSCRRCGRSCHAAPTRSWRGRSSAAGATGTCPLCGGEPDFSVITPAAERLLICSRCIVALALPPARVPVLPERGSLPHHVVRHARRPLPPERAATSASAT